MVLVFADQTENQIKKSSLEAISYGAKLAEQLGTTAEAVVINHEEQITDLGKYGASKVHLINHDNLKSFDAKNYSEAMAQVAEKLGAKVIVFSHNSGGKAIAPMLSARLKAGLVTGAVALPETSNGFVIKKIVFSGKAFANVSINTDTRIVSINPNSFGIKETGGEATIEKGLEVNIEAPKAKVVSSAISTGEVPLPEAELVVSGGRGLKGPENWGMIEDLAKALGASTACSRPVADAHWRPHHEHVGQTGGTIAPNLYMAIGISGAIQHLAGVNRSKVIVVINKDPEAPFFKAADYGIVGDAFEVVPKITEAVKKLKG
jgi:electron transfer flavoprotein alpha subunit